jgi:hypothetical protein
MANLNLKSIPKADMMPLPDVPESYGPRNAEDERVHDLVQRGLASGEPIPVDDAYFARLRDRLKNNAA